MRFLRYSLADGCDWHSNADSTRCTLHELKAVTSKYVDLGYASAARGSSPTSDQGVQDSRERRRSMTPEIRLTCLPPGQLGEMTSPETPEKLLAVQSDFCKPGFEYMLRGAFDGIWAREGLERKYRSLTVISCVPFIHRPSFTQLRYFEHG